MYLLQDSNRKQIRLNPSRDIRPVCCSEPTKVPSKDRNVHERKKSKTTDVQKTMFSTRDSWFKYDVTKIVFFLLYKKKRQNLVWFSSGYICPRNRWFSMNRFKGTRHGVTLTNIILLLLLLWQRLNDGAWIRIQIIPSATTLRARLTRSSSCKVGEPVGGPDAS